MLFKIYFVVLHKEKQETHFVTISRSHIISGNLIFETTI